MNDKAQAVFDLFFALDKFYEDVKRLQIDAEGLAGQRGLVPATDRRGVWEQTSSLDNPRQWYPHYSARFYRQATENDEPPKADGPTWYVSTFFTKLHKDEGVQKMAEPVLTVGKILKKPFYAAYDCWLTKAWHWDAQRRTKFDKVIHIDKPHPKGYWDSHSIFTTRLLLIADSSALEEKVFKEIERQDGDFFPRVLSGDGKQ